MYAYGIIFQADPSPVIPPSLPTGPTSTMSQQNAGQEILNLLGQSSQSDPRSTQLTSMRAGLPMPGFISTPGISLPTSQGVHSTDQLASLAAAAVGGTGVLPLQDPIKLLQEQQLMMQQQY